MAQHNLEKKRASEFYPLELMCIDAGKKKVKYSKCGGQKKNIKHEGQDQKSVSGQDVKFLVKSAAHLGRIYFESSTLSGREICLNVRAEGQTA